MDAAHTSERLSGYKRAYVLIPCDPDRSDAAFLPQVHGMTYTSTDVATCPYQSLPGHGVPPVPGCTCGFYALKEREKVAKAKFAGADFPRAFSSVMLAVQMYGPNVIEGTEGFRASAQQVTEVLVDDRCFHCRRRATTIVVLNENADASVSTEFNPYVLGLRDERLGSHAGIRAVCDHHHASYPSERTLTLADLSGMLGVDVSFARLSRHIARPPAARWESASKIMNGVLIPPKLPWGYSVVILMLLAIVMAQAVVLIMNLPAVA